MSIVQFYERPPHLSLVPNEDNERHYRVIGKTEGQGNTEIRKLVGTASGEEVWVFVTAKNKRGDTIPLWYEIGELINPLLARIDDDIQEAIALDLEKLGFTPVDVVVEKHYHPHVSPNDLPQIADLFRDYYGSGHWYYNWFAQQQTFSEGDYLRAVVKSGDYFQQLGVPYESQVFTSIGMWRLMPRQEYSPQSASQDSGQVLAEAILKRLANDRRQNNFFLGAFQLYRHYRNRCGMPRMIFGRLPIIGIFSPRYQCDPREIVENFSNEDIAIEFTP